MFYFNYNFEIVLLILLIMFVVGGILFFALTTASIYRMDELIKKKDETAKHYHLKISKIFFPIFEHKKGIISQAAFWCSIRSYIFYFVMILSFVLYAIFLTKLTFWISVALVVCEFLFVPIDTILMKILNYRKRKIQ